MSVEELSSMDSTEEQLCRLRQEVQSLSSLNDCLVSTIHGLSGELLKRRNPWSSPSSSGYFSNMSTKRIKIYDTPTNSSGNISPQPLATDKVGVDGKEKEDIGLPNEIMLHLFKFLNREELDSCSLVCQRWYNIIKNHESKLVRRNIRLLKIFEIGSNTGTITISAATKAKNIKFNLSVVDQNPDQSVHLKISQMLMYSKVRRCIVCSFDLKSATVHDLVAIFKRANIKFCRLELIGLSLRQVSAETFQRFIGEHINADQYFIDGIRDADSSHFDSKLFEKPAIASAEDITVYDITSINDDDVVLDVGDDVLLDFVFGRNTLSADRSSIYLDSPACSQSFVYNALIRFTQEIDLSRSLPHAEFAHCRLQVVMTNRNIRNEYDTEVQSEWSAFNKKNNCVLEAKVAKSPEDDEFVHITLTIVSPNCRIRS